MLQLSLLRMLGIYRISLIIKIAHRETEIQ